MARYKNRPKCLLLQRICVNGLLLDKFTAGMVLDDERPAEWEGGCVMPDETIYLVEFENLDPGVGVRRLWLPNEHLLILDDEHPNTPWATSAITGKNDQVTATTKGANHGQCSES